MNHEKVVDTLLKGYGDAACALSDSLIASDTTEPLYPFLKLYALGLKDLDFDMALDSMAFFSSYQLTHKVIDAWERQHGKTSYSLTLRGFAYATHASYFLMHKKYFAAINSGFTSLDLLKKAKELDQRNYDPDFFLGMYGMAKTQLRQKLWMVLFWYPTSEKNALEQIEQCASKGVLARRAASLALIDIYAQKQSYGKAQHLIDSLNTYYPESRFLLWSRARLKELQNQTLEAAVLYNQLSVSYARTPNGFHNSIVTGLKELQLLKKAGKLNQIELARKQQLTHLCECNDPHKIQKNCLEIHKLLESN